MIPLHPQPTADHACPHCRERLAVTGWLMPGMRTLARLRCRRCGRDYYGDLPSGHGLYGPALLDSASGEVYGTAGWEWFADWLRESFAARASTPVRLSIEEHRAPRDAVLLNCLDRLYGHCLLKLLNAQHYLDERRELDVIVLVPRFLRWMVPDGVAAIWTVEMSLAQGACWNDWLAAEISRRVEQLASSHLSVAYSHPHPGDVTIERFTGGPPFPIAEWERRLDQPRVAFIWRDDRTWPEARRRGSGRRLLEKLPLRGRVAQATAARLQAKHLAALARELRARIPGLEVSVAGLGRPGGLPASIHDLRAGQVTVEQERLWCRHYSQQHVVVGVHGSGMLLPSAHAGATVELMPRLRWGNMLQDLLLRPADCRATAFRTRVVPASLSPEELAEVVSSLLRDHAFMVAAMHPDHCRHGSVQAG